MGLWILFALDVSSARDQARADAVRSLSNIAAALAIDIAHNVEMLDRSLQVAGNGWGNDEIRALKPSLRHLVLFEHAMSAQTFGPLIILDPYGSVLARSDERQPDPYGNVANLAMEPGPTSDTYADRDDFKVHLQSDSVGLFVGSGFMNNADGQWSLPLSRRLLTPDGDFAGVVTGTLKLSYVQDAYRRLQLQQDGLMALATDDGILLARLPEISPAMRSQLPRLSAGRIGSTRSEGVFQAKSKVDGIERIYGFHRVGTLPLIQFAGMPLTEVYADWRQRTLTAGSLLLALSAGIFILQLKLGRELRSRIDAEAKLEELASRDALTGIANRRVFDIALDREWQLAMRRGSAVGLLMIDVDHFKAFNDLCGHLAGDEALRAIASRVEAVAQNWGGLGCRFGGEEFAMLLPAVIGTGARAAQDIIRKVQGCALPHSASPTGFVTISVGFCVAVPQAGDSATALVESADRQLYLAKQAGRNRCSPEATPSSTLAA